MGRTHASLLVTVVLLFTAAVTGQSNASRTAAVGDNITLPCWNVLKPQLRCNSTSWLVARYSGTSATELVTHGEVSHSGIPRAKADRLSVTESCDLVIRNVSSEDYGRYSCRQLKPGTPDSLVLLSVINIEQQLGDGVVLTCSVLAYAGCGHTVEWLHEAAGSPAPVGERSCSATVSLSPRCESNLCVLPRCSVTDARSGEKRVISPQPGGTSDGKNQASPKDQVPGWWFIVGTVGSSALLITIVALGLWTVTKRSKTQTDENTGQRLTSAVTQAGSGTSEDVMELEDGLSYASISYTKKAGGAAQAVGDGDGGDAVTYSTVRGPADDPSSLYATVSEASEEKVTE